MSRPGINRRTFVIGGSVGAVALATAGIVWLRSGKAIVADVELLLDSDSPERVTASFGEAVLALDDPRFPPIEPVSIAARAFDLFHLSGDERFSQTLRLFDVIAAFETPPSSLREVEQALYGPLDSDADSRESWLTQRLSIDNARFATWSSSVESRHTRFTELNVDDRRGYVDLWCRSALGVRRRIYKTLRAVIFSIAYSDPSVWRAIDYEGPFLAPTQQ